MYQTNHWLEHYGHLSNNHYTLQNRISYFCNWTLGKTKSSLTAECQYDLFPYYGIQIASPLDRKRLKILIPTYVKAVHFQFEIEFPRRFLHMGRRGPTDGETGRSEEEDESTEDDEINWCDGIWRWMLGDDWADGEDDGEGPTHAIVVVSGNDARPTPMPIFLLACRNLNQNRQHFFKIKN